MTRKPIPPPKRNGHLINGCLGWGLAFLLTIGVVDSRRVMPSTSFIIVTYVIGFIVIVVTGFWDFRWQQELYTIGVSATIYSITILILARQFLLALGAFVFLLAVLIYPPIAKQTHEQVRNRRQ